MIGEDLVLASTPAHCVLCDAQLDFSTGIADSRSLAWVVEQDGNLGYVALVVMLLLRVMLVVI